MDGFVPLDVRWGAGVGVGVGGLAAGICVAFVTYLREMCSRAADEENGRRHTSRRGIWEWRWGRCSDETLSSGSAITFELF